MINTFSTLPFLPGLWRGAAEAPALYDSPTGWIDFSGLAQTVLEAKNALSSPQKNLVFWLAEARNDSVAGYLSALQAGHTVAVLDPKQRQLAELIATYQPHCIIAPDIAVPAGYRQTAWPITGTGLWRRDQPSATALHPDLCLLLLTSGTTGGGKFVRLSYCNVASNTAAIIASLRLTGAERALLHLPLPYSFGLSVLHTQLAVGGSTVLTSLGMMERGFWETARQTEVSLFPGVPYHYQMLARLGLDRLQTPTLSTFLQAGGRLDPALVRSLAAFCRQQSGRFFVMYGQTEASPRLSCFDAVEWPDKIGSVGPALTGGHFSIEDDEVIYEGTNVMLGYATQAADLALGDTQHGRLATGDLGSLDTDGFLTLSGRKQRFAKLYGVRIALDVIEQMVNQVAPAAVLEGKDHIVIITAAHAEQQLAMTAVLQAQTSLAPGWLRFQVVTELPYHGNGKLDYSALRELAT